MTSLVERAKTVKVRGGAKDLAPLDVDLALAWLHGEVTTTQVAKTVGCTGSNSSAYGWILRSIKQAYLTGRVYTMPLPRE